MHSISQQLNNKKIGVLGLGYIGSSIIELLYEIKKENQIDFEIIPINKQNISLISEYQFDYFIQCAGNSGDFRNNLSETLESNICLNIELLKKLNISQSFVYISSTRIYGFSDNLTNIFDEESARVVDNQHIDFLYDGSKMLAESYLLNMQKHIPYNIKIARLSNVYGRYKDFDDTTLIKKIIRCKIQNIPIEIPQNINSKKDYIYIDDAVTGILKLLTFQTDTDILNIAYGRSYSLLEILNFLDLPFTCNEHEKAFYSNISIQKAFENIGFIPKIDILSGLKNCLKESKCLT